MLSTPKVRVSVTKASPYSTGRMEKGSRFRCLMLTHQPRSTIASFLNNFIQPHGTIVSSDAWMPQGYLHSRESRLSRNDTLLKPYICEELRKWWLDGCQGSLPNWDLVSTCTIGTDQGLLLVEAKAHRGELSASGKKKNGSQDNHDRIGTAIDEACVGLVAASNLNDWHLSRDSSYQTSNRFAFAWKIASLGIPVILVYLGFRNANEMAPQCKIFQTPQEWDECVRQHTINIVPACVWGTTLSIPGPEHTTVPLTVLISSAELNVCVTVP